MNRPTSTRSGGRWLVPGMTIVVLLLMSAPVAAAEYRLAPGDIVEISSPAMPELQQRSQINLDGEISWPLVGQMRVAGLPLSEVRAQVQALLPAKELRRRTDDGREYPIILSPNEINVVIAEYRPVYLNGDVSKPGEQPFRPGMIVRQAIALAGGYDIARFRMNNPFMEQADLRAEYQALWAEFALEQAHLARLRGEPRARPTPAGRARSRRRSRRVSRRTSRPRRTTECGSASATSRRRRPTWSGRRSKRITAWPS